MTHEHEEHDPPGGADTTGQGYPEENQPGTGIDARDHAEDDVTPPDSKNAPETHPAKDGDPSQATGNPNAAGG
jgi:hypothetical protein